ncbi:MAG: SMC family ATPase [Candidatus Omnitrophota bacterium]|jgi:exonuclease SbcC|nr:MAG: SMC family ATPase [Candidatus Omnitrophota bacterium]
MIPIQLRLRNFLSYGEEVEPLDFTTFKLACLSGRNGHGKSALLDAMTWAIWGEARKAGFSRTPDADLIRLDAEEMEVEFTFQLNGRDFQVHRNARRGKRAGKLEFRGKKENGNEFLVLTGSSKRETQKRIIDTLGLDYKTFINSSFLQQGKADEFTRQTPAERKEILGNILGLDYYDRLLEETKLRLNNGRAERKTIEEILAAIDQELTDENEARQEETRLTGEIGEKENVLEHLQIEEKVLREKWTALHVEKERIESLALEEKSLRQRQAELTRLVEKNHREHTEFREWIAKEETIQYQLNRFEHVNRELKRLLEVEAKYRQLENRRQAIDREIEATRARFREELAAFKSEREHLNQSLKTARLIIAQKEAIEKNYAEFKKTEAEAQRLETLRPRYEQLGKDIQRAEAVIEKERQVISEKIAELRGRTKRMESLKKEIADAQRKCERISTVESELTRLRDEIKTIEEQGQHLRGRIDQSKVERERRLQMIHENEEKISLLQRGKTQECFVCKRPLDENGVRELQKNYQTENQRYQSEAAAMDRQIAEDERQRDQLIQQYKQQKMMIAEKENESAQLRFEREALLIKEQELGQLATAQQEIEQLTRQLESESFAVSARRDADQLRKVMQELAYEPDRHQTVRVHLQSQRKNETMWERLQEESKKETQYEIRLKTVEERIAEIEHILENQDFAHAERAELALLVGSIKPLTDDLNQRQSLHDEQQKLRNAPGDWNRVQYAKERIPALEKEIAEHESRMEETRHHLLVLDERRKQLLPRLDELKETETQLQEKEAARKTLQEERDRLNLRLGGIREKCARFEQRKQEQIEKKIKREDLLRDERLYEILKNAFSRDGIPAMIVEQSLPELQEDANRILHRLTDGACSIRLESQREKKSGGVVETLDIKISDEMGTRDYEMYSGGEAFRTDLALRIALSQLLCRRAGSRLQLLVIDEGFGSQDVEGLNSIVEAINDIQDEFEKILLVTHLEELKEKFLTRIEVYKETGIGSRFTIVYTA